MTATGYELSDLRGKRLRRDHQSPPDNSPEVLIRAHPDRRREPESNPRYPAQPQCVHESIEDNGPPARKGRALQPGQIILNDVPGSPAGDQGPPRREPPLVLQGQAQSGRMARPSMPSFRSDVPGQPQVPGSRPDPAENRAPVLSTGHHPAAPNLASSSSFGTGKVTTGRSPYGPRIVVAAPAPGPQSHSVSPGRPIEPYCPFFEPQYRGPAHLPEPVRGAPVSGRSTSIRSTRNYPPAPVSRHTSRPPLGLMAQPPAQVRVPLSRPGPATTRDPIGPPRSNSAAPPLLSASRVQSVDLTRGSPQSVLADRTRRVPSGMEWEELAQPMEPQLQPLPATRTGHFDSLQLAGASPNIGSRWPSAAARSARRIPTTPLPIPVSHAPSAPTIPAPVPVPALGHFHTPLQQVYSAICPQSDLSDNFHDVDRVELHGFVRSRTHMADYVEVLVRCLCGYVRRIDYQYPWVRRGETSWRPPTPPPSPPSSAPPSVYTPSPSPHRQYSITALFDSVLRTAPAPAVPMAATAEDETDSESGRKRKRVGWDNDVEVTRYEVGSPPQRRWME